MDAKTKGAWIVHHADKLAQVVAPSEFENILVAGKAARLLSAIARSEQAAIANQTVEAFAKAANITRLELPGLLSYLESRHLVSVGTSGIDVLGITTSTVLSHTGTGFDSLHPTSSEQGVVELAELVSDKPLARSDALQRVGDELGIASKDLETLALQTEDLGFVDSVEVGGDKLYFNGNLFRRENARKIRAVLTSLSDSETRLISDVEAQLARSACLPFDDVQRTLGEALFLKLHAIGMYDVNRVSNDAETVLFVTRPSAFGKFGDPFVDDALDLAKAFVTCLTYGMTRSTASRGRIQFLRALLERLILGQWVGPATAIGQDYRVLEYKGVVRTKAVQGGMYKMKLLKRDVGELALHVLTDGDASDATVLHAASVTEYSPPESQRTITRKRQNRVSEKASRELLLAIRSGGG